MKRPSTVPAAHQAHAEGDRATASAVAPAVTMLELLVCPRTHGPLTFDEAAQELVSEKAKLAYPVRDGVPILLESEARPVEA